MRERENNWKSKRKPLEQRFVSQDNQHLDNNNNIKLKLNAIIKYTESMCFSDYKKRPRSYACPAICKRGCNRNWNWPRLFDLHNQLSNIKKNCLRASIRASQFQTSFFDWMSPFFLSRHRAEGVDFFFEKKKQSCQNWIFCPWIVYEWSTYGILEWMVWRYWQS